MQNAGREALAKLDAMAMQDVEALNLAELTHEVVAAEVKRVFGEQRK